MAIINTIITLIGIVFAVVIAGSIIFNVCVVVSAVVASSIENKKLRITVTVLIFLCLFGAIIYLASKTYYEYKHPELKPIPTWHRPEYSPKGEYEIDDMHEGYEPEQCYDRQGPYEC